MGSAAFGRSKVDAGPSKPIVPNVSSPNSGKPATKSGLIPDAFQVALSVVLKAPSGTFTEIGVSELPNTALILSPALAIFTYTR